MKKYICKEDFVAYHNCISGITVAKDSVFVLEREPDQGLYTLVKQNDKYGNTIYLRKSEVRQFFDEVEE